MRVKIDKHDEKWWTKMIAVLEYTCLTKGLGKLIAEILG